MNRSKLTNVKVLNLMKISIIMPTYNRNFTLPTAIDSIILQTHKKWELLIIDDGSTDHTQETVQKYIKKDNRIKYFRIPHKGTPFAWNLGITKSKNNLLFFIGDDCKLHKNCLENLLKTAEKLQNNNFGAVAPRLIYVKNIKNPREETPNKTNYAHIDPATGDIKGSFNIKTEKPLEVPIIHGYALTRKDALRQVGGFDQKTYKGNFYREETDLWLRIRGKGYKLYYEPTAKIYCQKGLTKGGQWSNVKENPITYEYYVIYNHHQFLKKFFGKRRFFMLPTFLLRRLYMRMLQLHAHTRTS